jgi:hypothetical protein
MYKIKVHRKHLIQVELDSDQDADLIYRIFEKGMVWSDPPMLPLDEGTKFAFMAYTTKTNLIHIFDLVGIRRNPYSDPNPEITDMYHERFKLRLYIDRKFIKKHMHRDNYLDQFHDLSKDNFRYNFKTYRKKELNKDETVVNMTKHYTTIENAEVKKGYRKAQNKAKKVPLGYGMSKAEKIQAGITHKQFYAKKMNRPDPYDKYGNSIKGMLRRDFFTRGYDDINEFKKDYRNHSLKPKVYKDADYDNGVIRNDTNKKWGRKYAIENKDEKTE